MTEKDILKLRKKAIKLSKTLSSMSPQDVEVLRRMDSSFDEAINNITDYVASANPYERVHPFIPKIRCTINGEIKVVGVKFELREIGGKVMIAYNGRKTKIPAAAAVLACFDPLPPGSNASEWEIEYLDGDPWNLKPANLRWKRKYVK